MYTSRTVQLPGQNSNSYVANPFIYSLEDKREGGQKYALCLYDCQGGLFTQSEIGEANNIFHKSLLDNDFLFFLYDPTQHAGCIRDYADKNNRDIWIVDETMDTRNRKIDKSKLTHTEQKSLNNDLLDEKSNLVLNSVKDYIEKYDTESGLVKNGKYTRLLYVIVTKCDEWGVCLSDEVQQSLKTPPTTDEQGRVTVRKVSDEVERWIDQHDQEFVSAVKGFAKNYIYVPVSATGRKVVVRETKVKDEITKDEGYYVGVEPLNPCWVDIPFLHAFFLRGENGL